MPIQALDCGRLTFTVLTLIPIGTIAQVRWTAKRWQMSDRYPFISSVEFRDPFSAFAILRSCLCAFNGYNDFSAFTQRSLQDPNIWNAERYRDLCFCHEIIRFCP